VQPEKPSSIGCCLGAETLAHLSLACAELLSAGTAGKTKRIAAFAHLLAIHIAEKYTNVASQRPDYRGGLPIARLPSSRTMYMRTSQKAFQSRYWQSWRPAISGGTVPRF
jgi:hypothetical protein